MSLVPGHAAFLLQHRITCRDRVRAAKLAGGPWQSLRAARAIRLDNDEERRVNGWHRKGLSRLDAIRIVVDPTMRPGAPR